MKLSIVKLSISKSPKSTINYCTMVTKVSALLFFYVFDDCGSYQLAKFNVLTITSLGVLNNILTLYCLFIGVSDILTIMCMLSQVCVCVYHF